LYGLNFAVRMEVEAIVRERGKRQTGASRAGSSAPRTTGNGTSNQSSNKRIVEAFLRRTMDVSGCGFEAAYDCRAVGRRKAIMLYVLYVVLLLLEQGRV